MRRIIEDYAVDAVRHSNRRSVWVPPPRPDWVARVNEEGRHLDITGIVPLDATSLIATSTANTGLSDFGAHGWREPFEVICRALDSEADLTLVGRILTRSDMLMLLEGRLRIEAAYSQHPEIEEEQITAPVLIVGQGRSGTSALFNLLAADPDVVVPRSWQAMLPGLGVGGAAADPRIATADQRITMWNRVTPELSSAHEFTGEIPTENIHIEALSFRSPSWQALYGQTPSHYQFMAGKSMVPAIVYGKRVFKLLQWRQPRRQWIMKSPDALNYLPDLLQVYPDVRLLWIHRDPVISLSSMVSLVGTLAWVRSDQVMSAGTFEAVADPVGAARMLTQPIEWIEAGIIPAERLHNIHYADFIDDPLAVIGGINRFWGGNQRRLACRRCKPFWTGIQDMRAPPTTMRLANAPPSPSNARRLPVIRTISMFQARSDPRPTLWPGRCLESGPVDGSCACTLYHKGQIGGIRR